MSNQQTLSQFFAAKTFEIPKYQRSYAWERQNIRELYEDIAEAISTNSSHYIGTVVLARTNNSNIYNIVDGQQRLTSIILFISAIISKIEDHKDQDYWKRYYIKSPDRFKLVPLERDRNFLFEILDNKTSSEPQNKSQRFVLNAYDEILNILSLTPYSPRDLLNAIGELYVLEFIENNESDAIRIFQTVNDRGKELSRMDKMKSLLFYFSNKYCQGIYDDEINNKFAEIFELYDTIKLMGESEKIDVISSKQFSEDDLLRHHHVCFSEESYDPTGQQVLDNVKSQLLDFRKRSDLDGLTVFLSDYLNSLLIYVRSFQKVISRVSDDASYYKIFSILGLSAAYYPVITMLEKNNFLDKQLPNCNIDVLKMVEIIDVRVLKIRGYAGRKYIADFSFVLNNEILTIEDIEQNMIWFNSFQISDDRLKDSLTNNDYYQSTGLLRALFIDYSEYLMGKEYSLKQLKAIMASEPTIEHILSQTPNFKPKAYGFKSGEDFTEKMNLLGNLTILERKINSAIKNSDITVKVKGYTDSKLKITSMLATELSNGNFKKDDMIQRGNTLVEYFAERWPSYSKKL